jgi:flagellar basal-body rod modification protein FlgD
MANTLNGISGSSGATPDPQTKTASPSTTQVSKNMFLQLLVAQIKNQDPMNPSDGVQFLTQLAQFQQLENGMNMGQDISAIRTDLENLSTNPTTSTAN